MELAAGLIGVVVGAGVTVGVAFLQRQWRRQEVRAAEKRARLEERFESVVRYGGALQEFVEDATSWMWVWREERPAGGWEHLSRRLQEELEKHWDEARESRPRWKWSMTLKSNAEELALIAQEIGAEVMDKKNPRRSQRL